MSGAVHAPSLIQFLQQNDVNILPEPEDIQGAIRNGESEVVLVIPEEYGEAFTRGESAPLKLVLDSSRTSSATSIQRAKSLITSYSGITGNLRLMARGVDPRMIAPITLETLDMATPQSQAMLFLISLPMFLMLTLFIGGMAVIIDTTAGERERGSLEPLLINPAHRWEIVVGKLMAALIFTLGSIILSIVAFAAIFNYVPIDRILDIPVSVNWMTFVMILLNVLPLIIFVASPADAHCCLCPVVQGSSNHTGMAAHDTGSSRHGLWGYMSIQSSPAMMLMPTISQQLLILQLLRGEAVILSHSFIAAGFTILVSIGLVALTIRMYSREKLLNEG